MFEDILIKLNPYLGRSKNLMEFFVIIGYEETILLEYAKNNNNLEDDKLNLEMSIISSVISDLAYGVFSPDNIIKQIYPDKPKIIKFIKKEEIPKPTSSLFYSCFDSLTGKNKILYSCYAYRFYEEFIIFNTIYYIPKAILIFSQYPYFTTFHNICLNIYEEIEKTKHSIGNESNENIPIEILLHCLVNYIPSPINNSLKLKLFEKKSPINIDKLTGYPYIDFNLCRVFKLMKINEFIKIYMLTFLEISLLFFYPNLVELNLFMYILNILNYPLIDSNYYWHIKSISKDEVKAGEETLNPYFRGVNAEFSPIFNFSNFRNLNYIVDIKNECIKCINEDDEKSEEVKEINQLLKFFHNILKEKKVKSYFLSDYLSTLYNKLKRIKNRYDKISKNYPDTFFYVDKNIIEINKQIQEAFYDFILNTLVQLNKDYILNSNCTQIVKKKVCGHPALSEEEIIFLKYYKYAIKYNTYFELFIGNFTAVDELKVSLVFTDEYVNVKIKDSKKEIPDKINYFQLMDNFYSNNPKEVVIDSNDLKKEFYKTYKSRPIRLHERERENENQLFELDKNLIKIFLFHKKSRDLFISLKIKEKEEIKIEQVEKIRIISYIESNFYSLLNRENYIRSASIYLFAIVFPLFPTDKSNSFLKKVLRNLNKMKYFQRYYIYIILKSIHKYYLINKVNNNFPNLTFEIIKNYCILIKDYLIVNSIIPNEEIFLFLEKILSDDPKKIKDIENKKIKIDKNNFVFIYKNEHLDTKIPDNIIIQENKQLIFQYKGQTTKYKLIENAPDIEQNIYSAYDNYFTDLNFNIVKFSSENINETIINIIFFLIQIGDKELACYVLNSLNVLKKLKKDLRLYNFNNNLNNNNINNDNINNNNINNNNINNNNINNSINNNINNEKNKNSINNNINNIINNKNINNLNNENNINNKNNNTYPDFEIIDEDEENNNINKKNGIKKKK